MCGLGHGSNHLLLPLLPGQSLVQHVSEVQAHPAVGSGLFEARRAAVNTAQPHPLLTPSMQQSALSHHLKHLAAGLDSQTMTSPLQRLVAGFTRR